MVEHTLEVKDLTKVFATEDDMITAVDAVNFQLSGDEFFTMLGPSGCGKTTTLRMIAGLETCTAGNIIFDGQDYSRFSAFQRNIGMVFQSYALFPHLSVAQNIAYGLSGRTKQQVKEQTWEMLHQIRLLDHADKYPHELSSGEQQRVAVARALVMKPALLLADEPTGDLDENTADALHQLLREMHTEYGLTSIIATHNPRLAAACDRVLRLEQGQLHRG